MKLVRAVMAEFFATAIFIYIGCGSVVAANQGSTTDIVGIALAFGLSITALAFTIGHHSGGHMNPIVTIAMFILGQVKMIQAVAYIAAQLVGAIVGAAFLVMTCETNDLKYAVNGFGDEGQANRGGAFVMEMVLSGLLVWVICETAVSSKSQAGNNAPIAIGLAVFMAHIVAIPWTGTSINPARSFGPAVVTGEMGDLWLFFLAPICGCLFAVIPAKFLFGVCDKKGDKESTKGDDNGPEDAI
jgi:aquaporin Z